MRLRRKPWVDEAIHAYDDFVYPKDRPAGEAERGRWQDVFGREAPLFVELGTGKGDFISEMAERNPQVNFIGIEKQQDVLIAAAQKVREKGLKNVRLLVFDIAQLEKIFAPTEITRFFVNFCDPWPKARHAKRRLTHRSFLMRYKALLVPGGSLFFKTDNRALSDFSLEEFREMGLSLHDVCYDLHREARPDNVMTEYERKFSGKGEKINRCEVTFA